MANTIDTAKQTEKSPPSIPAQTRIGHIHLKVSDLERAVWFYHEVMGFDVIANLGTAAFLSAGGYHHHLGTNTWATSTAAAGEDDARLVEWELVLPNEASVSAAGASVEAAGGTIQRARDGSILARDPWGTAVRLVYR